MKISRLLGFLFIAILLPATNAFSSTVYSIDINSGSSPTETGFVGLVGNNGNFVIDQGVTFTMFGSAGTRDRGTSSGANDLTRDFAFPDENVNIGAPVGVEITGLGAGFYQASVWSFEGSGANIYPEWIGYETDTGSSDVSQISFDPEHATDPASVFTFTYDPSTDGDLRIFAYGSVGFQCEQCPRARFNALQLAAVPIPAAVWLFGSGLIGLIGVARRKKA